MNVLHRPAHYVQHPLFPPKFKTLQESLSLTKTQLRNYFVSSECIYGPTWIAQYLTRIEQEGQTLLKLHVSPNKPAAAYLAMMLSAYFKHQAELPTTLQGFQQIEAYHINHQTREIRFTYTVQAYIQFNL